MTMLKPNDTFPRTIVTPAGAGDLVLPTAFAGDFGVVLFTRGSWCPYCNAQLRGFQRAQHGLRDAGVRVVSLSVDDEASTLELIAKHGLTFPVGHSADAEALSAATGAFVDPRGGFLQATGFIVDPTGTVLLSVYSSGAIGRLVAEDVIGFIAHARAQKESAA